MSTTVSELAKEYGELKMRYDLLSAERKEMKRELDGYYDKDLEEYILGLKQKLAAALDEGDMKSVRLTDLGLFTRTVDNKPKIFDEEALFEWLENNGREAIIKRSVHYMTLKGLCNELAEDFADPPPGVEVTPQPNIRFTKAK